MDDQFEIVEEAVVAKKPLKQTIKKYGFTIAKTVTTIFIAGALAYTEYRRENRKEEKYNEHLDDKLELQREALGLYKDSLENERPSAD